MGARSQQANTAQKPKRRESYGAKVNRLSKAYPAVAEAKAHLDEPMALVENGE